MQSSRSATKRRHAPVERGEVQRLARSWEELSRFVLGRKFQAALHQGVAGDLSPAQLHALLALAGDALRMGELACSLGLAESSVTRLVDRLEAGGLVERVAGRDDRRSVVCRLTGSGEELVRTIQASRAAFLTEILLALEPPERHELVSLLGRIAEVLRRHEAEAVGRGAAGGSPTRSPT